LRLRLNHVFQHLSKSNVPTSYLAEYGIPFVPLSAFDGLGTSTQTANIQAWNMAYESWRTSYTLGESPAPTLDSINARVARAATGSTIVVPLFLGNYNQINPGLYNNLALLQPYTTDQIKNLSGSDFVRKDVFVAAPHRGFSKGRQVSLLFKPDLLFGNSPAIVPGNTMLQVDWGDGQGFQGMLQDWNAPITRTYLTAGKKLVKVLLNLSAPWVNHPLNNRWFTAHFELEVFDNPSGGNARFEINRPREVMVIEPRPFGQTPHAGGRVTYQLSQFNNTGRIRKPLIVLEGFDVSKVAPSFQPNFDFSQFIPLLNPENLQGSDNPSYDFNKGLDDDLNGMGLAGYDLIFLDYTNGTSDIRHNATLFQILLRRINTIKQGTEQAVVVGISMGGLVARYGLAQMVRNGENPQTRLLITHDSPHRGANVPLGFQFIAGVVTTKKFGIYAWQRFAPSVQELANLYNAPATQQLLMHRLKYADPFIGQSTTEIVPNTFLNNEYRAMIDNLTTPYQTIATSLGSECGLRSAAPYTELVRAEGTFYFNYSPISTNTTFKTEIRVNALPQKQSKQIAWLKIYSDYLLFGIIPVKETIIAERFDSPAHLPALDGTGGGIYNIENIIAGVPTGTFQDFGVNFLGVDIPVGTYNIRTLAPNFCFVPTPSALDVATIDDASLLILLVAR
jgi:hypothetical protein